MNVVTTDSSPEVIEMGCADENFAVRKFVRSSEVGEPVDYTCPHCGWMQSSGAAGAAELCRSATWGRLTKGKLKYVKPLELAVTIRWP